MPWLLLLLLLIRCCLTALCFDLQTTAAERLGRLKHDVYRPDVTRPSWTNSVKVLKDNTWPGTKCNCYRPKAQVKFTGEMTQQHETRHWLVTFLAVFFIPAELSCVTAGRRRVTATPVTHTHRTDVHTLWAAFVLSYSAVIKPTVQYVLPQYGLRVAQLRVLLNTASSPTHHQQRH